MARKVLAGQRFLTEWQYATICGDCGLRNLYVTKEPTLPPRVRGHCPKCEHAVWLWVKELPEAM